MIFVVFMITAAAALGLAAAAITGDGQAVSADFVKSGQSFYAARSGIEWALRKTNGFTTADRARWESLDGAVMDYAGAGGPSFTLGVVYSDPDNDPSTADTVTLSSTGLSGDVSRTIMMRAEVPAEGGGMELFSDHFDGAVSFDDTYIFGIAQGPHGPMTPYATAAAEAGGDIHNVFTTYSETGGRDSVLVMGGRSEARLTVHTGQCFKWSAITGVSCGYDGCASFYGCQARAGIDAPVDEEGFQNYFIKIRFRLISGNGFGVYFRASYPADELGAFDFGALTSYVWQYDMGLGYLSPCDMMSAVAGSDGEGMLFTRRIDRGSKTCGALCGLFGGPNPAPPENSYPFFCPENRTGREFLNGWRWRNADWTGLWRTVYIYVYRDRASIWLGREEIAGYGSESAPEPAGVVSLDSVDGLLKTGDIGMRAIEESVVEIDYIRVYNNDADNSPSTFSGAF